MTAPNAETITTEITNEANTLLNSTPRYLDESDLRIAKLILKARKLMNASAFEAHIAHALIYQICGDIDKINNHLRIASKLGDPLVISEMATLTNINLGYYSIAQENYKQYGSPKNGKFLSSLSAGYASLSFSHISEFIKQAKKMEIDLNSVDCKTAEDANSILVSSGLDQTQFARILDLVGETFRENKVFYANEIPEIFIDNKPADIPCIYITFFIKESLDETARIYNSFISRLTSEYEEIPDSVHISIQSAT